MPLPLYPSTTVPQPTLAQWTWDTSVLNAPKVVSYPTVPGCPTKTGLTPQELQNFVGIPLVLNLVVNGLPVQTPLNNHQLLAYLRQAEDWVEQNSGVLLCTTWVGSPPVPPSSIPATGVQTTNLNPGVSGMVQGIDFDLVDIGYDFFYRRFLMEGWGVQQLRYRPLQNIYYISFIYPLLSEFFKIPLSWAIQDKDSGNVRIVPAANVQMLPLFAMQLAFMGFAQSLPQAMWFQYTAGLTSVDYASRFAFMKTLVLTQAAIYALNTIQGTVNYGAIRSATSVDGLRYETSYPANGAAYSGLITSFTNQRDELLRAAIDLVRGGFAWISL